MKKKTIHLLVILGTIFLCFFSTNASAKNKIEADSSLCLIEKYNLSGEYSANIEPKALFFKFSGRINKIELIKISSNLLQLQFVDFHTGKMPFAMTVDIKMDVTEKSEGQVILAGEKGLFRAIPVDKSSEKKEKISEKASIKGTYTAEGNNGKFSFILKPGFFFPVNIYIDIDKAQDRKKN